MSNLAHQILEHAGTLPEGSTLVAKTLLHLGGRAAVDQALSRLTRTGHLLRASRGVYVLPVTSRFGTRAPEVSKVVGEWAAQRGETVVGHGAGAANALGLTTQVPVRQIFLTSGSSRKLKLGAQTVELRHAPPWQLIYPGQPAGDVIRSLAWIGPSGSEAALKKLRRKLPASELQEVANARARLPTWPMPDFFELTRADQREALLVAAERAGRPAHLLEKDIGWSGHSNTCSAARMPPTSS
jgi:Family of unknown function (DUF6088)